MGGEELPKGIRSFRKLEAFLYTSLSGGSIRNAAEKATETCLLEDASHPQFG